tara:strand:- start:2580 stop:3152 length:573 start_codon:yes stop_codon:yes gene_type:complete
MEETDLSYNLYSIKNFSELIELRKKYVNIPDMFLILNQSLTHDLNEIKELESKVFIDISYSAINNYRVISLQHFFIDNSFSVIYDFIETEYSIDELYDKFKSILEIYPSIILRQRRNIKIQKCDFVMLEDFEIDETEKNKWKEYRKNLRDITKNINESEIKLNSDNTFNVEWPEPPNKLLLLENNYYNFE